MYRSVVFTQLSPQRELNKMKCLHGKLLPIPQQAMDPFGFVVKTLPAISSVRKATCMKKP